MSALETNSTGLDADDGSRGEEKRSAATILVELAVETGAEFFGSPDGRPYATLNVDGHHETHSLQGTVVKNWLSRLYYDQTGKAANSAATGDALNVLRAKALFDGLEHEVYTRLAGADAAIYLDLCDPEWQAVEVTAEGWRVVQEPPVRFVRRRGMLALPHPQGGGSLLDLRSYLNFGTETSFRLMVAWLVMSMRPSGPYPVLAIHGEQGSGKSTCAEMLRKLVDPNQALLRPPPRDERDLMIAGSNGRVIALENLSVISPSLSDSLCRISTGSGFATRELYSDSEETIFDIQRPIVINGIAEVIEKGDLQDRSIVISLPRIRHYASEDELWDRFDAALPRLLGGLLDVVRTALANEPSVELEDPPRMADFARWSAAAAPALGWDAAELLRSYADNRAAANETVLGASPLVGPLRTLGEFEGTATELLDELVGLVGESVARSKEWPKSASKLSNELRRLAPVLRRADPPLHLELGGRKGKQGRRMIWIGPAEREPDPSSVASASSVPRSNAIFGPPDDDVEKSGAADGADDDSPTDSDVPMLATPDQEAEIARMMASFEGHGQMDAEVRTSSNAEGAR